MRQVVMHAILKDHMIYYHIRLSENYQKHSQIAQIKNTMCMESNDALQTL